MTAQERARAFAQAILKSGYAHDAAIRIHGAQLVMSIEDELLLWSLGEGWIVAVNEEGVRVTNLAEPYEKVAGECPMGCGKTLVLSPGGHVTCSAPACRRPGGADALLHLSTSLVVAGEWELERVDVEQPTRA